MQHGGKRKETRVLEFFITHIYTMHFFRIFRECVSYIIFAIMGIFIVNVIIMVIIEHNNNNNSFIVMNINNQNNSLKYNNNLSD